MRQQKSMKVFNRFLVYKSCRVFFLFTSFALFISTFSFSQSLAGLIQDSINSVIQKRKAVSSVMLQYNSPSTGAVPYTIKKFDHQGNAATIIDVNGKHPSLVTHEYDSQGRLVKKIYHDNRDTSKITSWEVIEYNDTITKYYFYKADGSGRLIRSVKNIKEGRFNLTIETHYGVTDTTVFVSRSSPYGANCILTDNISYGKHHNVVNLETYYTKYDTKGKLIEIGKMNYVDSSIAFMKSHPEFMIGLYSGDTTSYQLILDRKFEGEPEIIARYTYDDAGNISTETKAFGMDSTCYSYNDRGQVIEARHFGFSSSIEKYEYDENSLLIRVRNNQESAFFEYVYTFYK